MYNSPFGNARTLMIRKKKMTVQNPFQILSSETLSFLFINENKERRKLSVFNNITTGTFINFVAMAIIIINIHFF